MASSKKEVGTRWQASTSDSSKGSGLLHLRMSTLVTNIARCLVVLKLAGHSPLTTWRGRGRGRG